MRIERARELGLCFGIRRAVAMLRKAATECGRIETLGPVAHNRLLMSELEALGVVTVSNPDELTGPTVVISAHGVPPETIAALKQRGFNLVDTTCPIVTRAQTTSAQLAHEGFTIVIFGDSGHTEVKGLLGWAGSPAMASTDGAALVSSGRLRGASKLAVIAQTTQLAHAFARFAASVCTMLTGQVHELRIVNTLCDATQRRLEAAMDLANRVDIMLVVGGRESANTRRLAEACSSKVETHHIESIDELQDVWFRNKLKAGVTAGASTPDSSIEAIERKVRTL